MVLGDEMGRFIARVLDDDIKRQSYSELLSGIEYLAAMLETELSDIDRRVVVEELCKYREEFANRVARKAAENT